MNDIYKLYGVPISLYTGKARAYMRYKNIPFVEERGDEAIFERIGRRIIPVIHTPDDALIQDTTEIIDYFEKRFPGPSVYPDTALQNLVALLFEVFGDEWLLMPAMHYRWKYNFDYIIEQFGKSFAPDASPMEQHEIGKQISEPFRGSLPFLGITEKSAPEVEAWYEELLNQLNEHFETHLYLLGSRPSIGDYGLMGPLYAHNYRDPWSGNLMRRIAPNVARWIDLMNTPDPCSGSFLADDVVPETLLPILKRMFLECIPAMVETVAATGDWIDANPDADEIPRAIGEHEFRIGKVREKRMIRPFQQWMFQRPLSFYQSLSGGDKDRVDGLLKEIGGYDTMQTRVRRPVKIKNYRLVAG